MALDKLQSNELDEILAASEDAVLSGNKPTPVYTGPEVRMALCGPEFLRGIIHYCDGSCCGLNVAGQIAAPPVRRIIDGDLIIEGPEA